MINRHIGKFYILNEMLDKHPDKVRMLMRDVIVVRAEQRYDMDGIEYYGISDWFDIVPEFTEAPLYAFDFADGEVSWRKV